MTDIEEKIAKAEEEIRQLQNRKRKLLNQKKDAERKARTHRLIERGAILESLLEKPEQYSNEQIKGLLEVTFQTAQAQEHLRKIGEETGRIKSPLLDKGALIHPYGCVRSAEGLYQRSADTGELHSPTGISFPTPCVLHARRYPALQSIVCHEV